MRRRYTLYIISAVLLFLGVALLNNAWFSRYQLDMTAEGLYTLSSGTRSTLQKLEEPITLRFFFSRNLSSGYPSLVAYADRIRTLLEQYVSLSKGKVTLQVIDPEPFSNQEDMAVAYGLQGVSPEGSQEKIFLGLVATNSTDDVRAIPFFNKAREKFIEYELTRMVFELTHPQMPILSLLSTLPLEDPNNPASALSQQLDQLFHVKYLKPDVTAIPEGTQALVLVHPRDLSEGTLYAIDQYVVNGGKLIAFVDPIAESLPVTEMEKRSSDINRLLHSWGVEVPTNRVVGDRQAAQKVAGKEGEVSVVDYLPWLSLREDAFDKEALVTGDINALNFATAGYIAQVDGVEGVEVESLVHTSKQSMLIDTADIGITPEPEALLEKFQPDGNQYTLVARISGKLRTAFMEGNPVKSGAAALEDHRMQAKEPTSVIVVTDTDILRNEMWVQLQQLLGYTLMVPFADNGAFVLNLMDYMSGSEALISLRARREASRPFLVVEKLRRQAEEHYLVREKQLKQQLEITEKRLQELQSSRSSESGQLTLSSQQELEIERFRRQAVETRKELRSVQRELHRGIERLERVIKILNIVIVPLVVVIVAVIALAWRRKIFEVKV